MSPDVPSAPEVPEMKSVDREQTFKELAHKI